MVIDAFWPSWIGVLSMREDKAIGMVTAGKACPSQCLALKA